MPFSELGQPIQGATDSAETTLEFPVLIAGIDGATPPAKRILRINTDGSIGGTVMRSAFTDRSGTITLGGTAQTLAAVNANRSYLEIQNNSTGDLWINWTTTAVQSQPSLKIPVGATYVSDPVLSTELVSIIGATTGQTFTAKEA